MSFLAYVRQRRITDDDLGDFIMVARLDDAMPDAEHWRMLECYLQTRYACPQVFEAARQVWRAYLAARRRAEPRRRRRRPVLQVLHASSAAY